MALVYHVVKKKKKSFFGWKSYVVSFFGELIGSLEKFNEPLHVIVGWNGDYLKKAEKYPGYEILICEEDGVKEKSFPERVVYETARKFLQNELPRLGIASWLVVDYKAKDMAIYATKIAGNEGRLVSDDYDWLLAMTENTILYRPIKDEAITWNKFEEMIQHENPYEVYKWLKAIKGKALDNVLKDHGIGWEFVIECAKLLADSEKLLTEDKSIKESIDLIKRNYELFTILDVYNEIDTEVIEETFNGALNNREVPSQEKWFELSNKIDLDKNTLSLWYNELKEYLKAL